MKTCTQCNAEIPDDAVFCPECGAGQASRSESMPQQTVGGMGTIGLDELTLSPDQGQETPLDPGEMFAERYEIEGEIGQGGMGVVYRAKDTLTGKTIALKLVNPRLIGNEAAVQRLIAEGATAQDIRHANIVSVYDVGRAQERVYVSMEYVEGASLRQWISEQMASGQDVPMRLAARIVAECLDGLKAAHARGVIHRDLKPENIILTQAPDEKGAPLKILDFGIARSAGTSAAGLSSSGALGTLDYMAPEQRTNPDSAGPAADHYSLSKIFYELLVGVLPAGHWQPPSGGRTDVPPGIDALIEQGLSNRPQARPQSAADYRSALVDAVNMNWRPSVPPRRVSDDNRLVVPPGDREARSWLRWGGMAAAGVVVIGAGLSLVDWAAGTGPEPGWDEPAIWDEPDPQPRPAPAPASLSRLSGSWNDGTMSYRIRISDDGSFSGNGTAPTGENMQISGRLPRQGVGQYSVTSTWSGATTSGTISWDGGCHVSFQYPNAFTGQPVGGQFHIDHAPGAPCPARLR